MARDENVEEKGPPLQTQVISTVYDVRLLGETDLETIKTSIATCLQAETLPRERRGKAYDLRPLIESIEFGEPDAEGQPHLTLLLAAREGATGRPEEVLDALGIPYEDTRVERSRMLFREKV